MKVLPTLQIQNGRLVPGTGGEDAADPMGLVSALLDRGCNRLCLLDVDAAQSKGHNRELLARILHRFRQGSPKVCIQVGGGIRSSDHAQFYLDQGATWLLVGTILYRFPLAVEQLLARFREQMTAAIDVRGQRVQASGWTETTWLTPMEAAVRVRQLGFRRILFSDIPQSPDAPPDFATALQIAECAKLPMLMGGSIRSAHHVSQASETRALQGVLVDPSLVLEAPELLDSQAPACG